MSELEKFLEELQRDAIERAREIYSDTVVDHWMHPRNCQPMKDAHAHARIKGPCGDTMEIFLKVGNGRIIDASFLTDGCITSIAAASMAVQLAIGRDLDSARAVSQQEVLDALGGLPDESSHCALLAANTLRAAVCDYDESLAGEPSGGEDRPAAAERQNGR